MKAITHATFAGLLALFWALPLFAESGEADTEESRDNKSRQAIWAESQKTLLQGIALSESQQDRIEALDAEYAAQIDERQQRRSELREELNAAQQAGQVSEAKRIRRQLREFRRSPTRPAHLRAIREVLTAPQQVTFDQNRKAFRERAQEQRERARLQRPPRPVPMEEPAEEGASEEGAGEASP